MSAQNQIDNPYELIGGEEKVRALVEHFYDAMSDHEPALTALHQCDENGRVDRGSRDRFALFLIGWLGGPQTYMERHGHPRLRMRHGKVPVNAAMRDGWLRSMKKALDTMQVQGNLRGFLDARFAEVAEFLRNAEG